MGKPATPRQLAETEAKAYLHGLKVSPRKLNLVAALDDLSAIRRPHLRRPQRP